MIARLSDAITFYAHYIASKVGATGLTVTVDVWEVQRDGTATEIATAAAATEIGDGLYRYLLSFGNVDEEGEYVAVFKTSDSSVDQQHLPAVWTIGGWAENIDATLSSRSTVTTAQVNAEADQALADYDPPTKAELDAGLAGLNDLTATEVEDAVWDATMANHLDAGSTGEALDGAGSGASASAIADAVWDEAIAGHLSAGSTGLKLNSFSGSSFPAGAIEFTYTVTNSVGGAPLEGVEVWVSTDNPATNIIWKGDTDAFGVAMDVNGNLPMLDAGTYYFWRQLSGFIFSNPDTEVIS